MDELPIEEPRSWKDADMSGFREKMGTPEGRAVYARVARQIVEDTGITEGRALDLGGGCGFLAEAMARVTGLSFVVCDPNLGMLAEIGKRVRPGGGAGRILPLCGRAEAIPAADGAFDLLASRGSFLFWEDASSAAREIARVLAPGGQAYLGGGMGRGADGAEVARLRARLFGGGPSPIERRPGLASRFLEAFRAVEAVAVRMIEEDGLWFHVTKRGRA